MHVMFLAQQPYSPLVSFLAKRGMTIKCSTYDTDDPKQPS